MLAVTMRKRTIRDVDPRGQSVLVRVDLNVPLDDAGRVADDTRIRAIVPTVRYLAGRGARVILAAHFGRPKGAVVETMRLAPVVAPLAVALGQPVAYARDCVGPEAEAAVAKLTPGDVLLLENLRFHLGEETNDAAFAKQLASLATLYVNDAFGAAHRAHASTEAITHELPSVAGLLMEQEVDILGRAMESPDRPYAAVIGGAKVSSKLKVLRSLIARVDRLLIGGGMANTFIAAEGFAVGDSKIEGDLLDEARAVMAEAESRGARLMLPADVVVADSFAANARTQIVPVKAIPEGWQVLDIGPQSVSIYTRALQGCRTVLWNGPMGVFEWDAFAQGSLGVGRAIADLPDCTTIVGGGETAQLAQRLHAAKFSHISTGGGATLEFLEGRVLPGVAALPDA